MLAFCLVFLLPFIIAGLLIAAGAHYIVSLAVGAFLLICIAKGLE